jgi:hypothetical protein
MRMRMRAVFGMVLLAGLGATGLAARPAAGADAPGAAVQPTDPFTRDLLGRLNSTDPGQREAAKKELADIAKVFQQADLLKQLGQATTDAELQLLIDARVHDLKGRQMMVDIQHLPPISLNVSGATLAQLVTALNEALGPDMKMTASRSNAGTWTLEAKDKPFWEIFAALTQQRPLSFNAASGQPLLVSSGTAIQRYVQDGPAIAYVGAINFNRTIALQGPNGEEKASPAALTAAVTVVVDPRVRVYHIENFSLVSAKDDAGHSLLPGGGRKTGYSGALNSNQITTQFTLAASGDLGKTMTLVCEASVLVAATEYRVSLDDVAKNVDMPVTLAGRTVRVTRFDIGGTGQAQLEVTLPPALQATADGRTAINFSLVDARGATIWTGSTLGKVAASIGGAGTGPYRLDLRLPGKNLELPVHFELKDIPLP